MSLTKGHLSNPIQLLPPPQSKLPVPLIPDDANIPTTTSPLSTHQDSKQITNKSTPRTSDHCYQLQSRKPYSSLPPATTVNPSTVSPSSYITHSTPTAISHLIPDNDASNAPIVHTSTANITDDFERSTNPFGHSTEITLPIKCNHTTISLALNHHHDADRIILTIYLFSTPASHIHLW